MPFPTPITYVAGGDVIPAPGSSTTGYAGFQLGGTIFLFLMLVMREAARHG
jgi:hypothetical protein